MSNMRGASLVGRDDGGRSYVARSVGRGELVPQRRRRGAGGCSQPRGGTPTRVTGYARV